MTTRPMSFDASGYCASGMALAASVRLRRPAITRVTDAAPRSLRQGGVSTRQARGTGEGCSCKKKQCGNGRVSSARRPR